MLYLIVSWRIAWLMRVGRTRPELEASELLAADKMHSAYVSVRRRVREKLPALNLLIRMVASRGGFLGRKRDGEPGAKTLRAGMQRVMDAMNTIQIVRDDYDLLFNEP